MFGINTLTIEAKVELRLIQCDPYHTWTFLNPSLTFKSDHYFYVFFCIQVPSILQYIYQQQTEHSLFRGTFRGMFRYLWSVRCSLIQWGNRGR